MPRSFFSEDQIRDALSDLRAGRTVREVSLEHGISEKTLYRWRAKLTNRQRPDANVRLRSLEEEHRRLKERFAELTLDYATLRAGLIRDVMGDC